MTLEKVADELSTDLLTGYPTGYLYSSSRQHFLLMSILSALERAVSDLNFVEVLDLYDLLTKYKTERLFYRGGSVCSSGETIETVFR